MTNASPLPETGKHTELPWQQGRPGYGSYYGIYPAGDRAGKGLVAFCQHDFVFRSHEEMLANAALIVNAVNAYPQIEAMRKALEEAKASILEIQSLARKIDGANEDSGFNIANIIISCDMASADLEAALQPLKKEA